MLWAQGSWDLFGDSTSIVVPPGISEKLQRSYVDCPVLGRSVPRPDTRGARPSGLVAATFGRPERRYDTGEECERTGCQGESLSA